MVWVWAGLGLRIRFEVCARGCAFFLCWPLEHDRPRELHQSIYTAKSTARKGARCQVPGAHRCLLPAACCLLSARYHVLKRLPQAALPPTPPLPPSATWLQSKRVALCVLPARCTALGCTVCLLASYFLLSAVSRLTRQTQIGVLQSAIANVDSPPARPPLRISSHGRTATRNVRSTHCLPESTCNSPRRHSRCRPVTAIPSPFSSPYRGVHSAPQLLLLAFRWGSLHRSGSHGPNALANLACHKIVRGRPICCKNHRETRFCSTAACSLISWSVLGALR